MKPVSITSLSNQNDRHFSGQQLVNLVQMIMASVFWDMKGVIFIDYLEKGKTINSDDYIELLKHFNSEIVKKRPHIVKKNNLFHQDNAPCHKSIKTMKKCMHCALNYCPIPVTIRCSQPNSF